MLARRKPYGSLTAFCAFWFAILVTSAAAQNGPSIGAILTIGGAEVSKPNRGATDAFADVFFNANDISFEQARAFSFEDIANLPQREIQVTSSDWPAAIDATGPLLSSVLASAGVGDDKPLTIVALDGYLVELMPEERSTVDWVLAHSVDGVPLSLGGYGPLWLLPDTPNVVYEPEQRSSWVWSIYFIQAD